MAVPALRGYQIDTVAGVSRAFFTDDAQRVMIAAPTRSGKTVIAGHIIERLVAKGFRVGFYVWSRQIMHQTLKDFRKWGIDCSVFAAEHVYDPAAPVFIAMAQTVRTRKNYAPHCDWLFCDEAHQVNYDKIIRDAGDDAKVVGLSATPVNDKGFGLGRKDGKGKGFDALVQGASYTELRDLKALVPVIVYSPEGDAVFETLKANPKSLQSSAKAILRDRELIGDPIAHWKQRAFGRPTVMFVDGVEASKGWADKFNAAGIPAQHVDGDTDEDRREHYLREFDAGRIKLLVNDSVFTVGWDSPRCSCVINYRTTGSLRLWRQAGARGMGACEGKTDCVVLDHGGSALAFGPPDMDIEWALDARVDAAETLAKERAQKIKDGEIEPTVCSACGAWRENRGPVCPYCGHVAAVRGKIGHWLAGHLQRLDDRIKDAAAGGATKKWEGLLYWAASAGRTVAVCVARFKNETGFFPHELNVLPGVEPWDWKTKAQKVGDWQPRFRRRPNWGAKPTPKPAAPSPREVLMEQFNVPPEIRRQGPDVVDWFIKQQAKPNQREAYREQALFKDTIA